MIIQNELISLPISSIAGLYQKNTQRIFNALFQWDNLPKGLKSLHIEKFLFEYGTVAVFKIGEKVYVLPATMQEWDLYGDMTKGYAFSPYKGAGEMVAFKDIKSFIGNNSKEKWLVSNSLTNEKGTVYGCFIKNNLNKLPTMYGMEPILKRLDNLFLALIRDTFNSRNQRIFITSDSSTKNQMTKEINRLNASTQLYEILNQGTIGLLKDVQIFNDPSKQKDLWEDFKQTEQLYRKNLGIPYDSRPEKKERVLEAEINASQLENALLINDMLEMRLEAVEVFNKVFNANISVKLTKEVESLIASFDKTMLNEKPKKEENENDEI